MAEIVEGVRELSVAEQCAKSYRECLNFVNYCQSEPNETIIHECVVFCNVNINLLNHLHNKVAVSGGQKQSCIYTLNLIQSLRDDLTSMLEKVGGGGGAQHAEKCVKWLESQTAFGKSIRTGIIKNLRHIDPKAFFEDAKNLFLSEIRKTLDDKKCSLKVFTVLEAIYKREKNEETVEELKHFNTKTFPIFYVSDLEKLFDKNVSAVTLKDMEEFEDRESGWTLKRVELLNVIINKYNPMRCGCHLPLPDVINKKKACINIKNSNDECFKWSVIAALTHLKGYKIHNASNVSEYRKYESEFNLNFDKLGFPIRLTDISKFEEKNNLSINLYILQYESNKYKVLPIYLTSDKKTETRHIHL